MTTILDLINSTFPNCSIARENIASLASVLVDTNCGEDCNRAITAAFPLMCLLSTAHGRYADAKIQPLCDVTVDLCLLYING